MTTAAQPGTLDALREVIADAHASRTAVPAFDLSRLDRVIDFSPDDMTVVVEAGLTVRALQDALADAGQWLPIDPPDPAGTTIADLLQWDISGPRRYGYGAIREHVIGMAAVVGDGRLIRSGGRVVKNVAGFDLARLFIGDRRTLGIVVEVAFKLMPRPASERLIQRRVESLDDLQAALDALATGPTSPVAIDVHSLDRDTQGWTLTLAYAGHPDDVDWQLTRHEEAWQKVEGMDHEVRFWAGRGWTAAHRTSVPASALASHLATRGDVALVCRAGNGVVYAAGPPPSDDEATRQAPGVADLTRRLKETFDPHGVFGGGLS